MFEADAPARRLALARRQVEAQEAQRLGLVWEVVGGGVDALRRRAVQVCSPLLAKMHSPPWPSKHGVGFRRRFAVRLVHVAPQVATEWAAAGKQRTSIQEGLVER